MSMLRIWGVLLLVLITACGGGKDAPAPAAETKAEPAPPPPFNAKMVFTTVCASCHGVSGAGDGPAGVALDPRPASFADGAFWEGKDRAYIVKVISEGGASVGKSPVMVGYGPQFDAEKIGEIADIVMGFKPAVAEPAADPAAPPADAP
jgi:cytochrome c553